MISGILGGVAAGVAVDEVLKRAANHLDTTDEEIQRAVQEGDIDRAMRLSQKAQSQSDPQIIIDSITSALLEEESVDEESIDSVEQELYSRV